MVCGSEEEEERVMGWSRVRRRVGGLAAALVLVTGAAACGTGSSGGGDSGGGGGGGGGGGTVTLKLTGNNDQKAATQAAIAAFEKANPKIRFDQSYAPVDQLQTSLRAQLGGGNAPDVFTVWPGNGSAMAVDQVGGAGLLADISGQSWLSRVPDSIKKLLGVNGKTYLWSPGVATIGAVYNEDVFKRAGVKIPTTWSQLLAAAQKLKAAGKIPIVTGNQTPWVTQLISYAIAPSTAFTQDPNLAEDMLAGKKSFADSGWGDVFKRYLELQSKGFLNPNPNGTTFEQQINMVASGKAAMAVQVSAVLPSFRDAAKGRSQIGFFPFPANDQPGQLKIPAGVASGLAISANTKHMAEAKKFIEFMGQPEQIAAFAKATANVPLDAKPTDDVGADLKPFVPYLAENKTVPFMDQEWPNAQVQPTHFAMVQDLLAHKVTVPQALAKLDEAYKKK
jgi:ABC-type glycerol-3-phosphate transport system substrate-binding protein